MQLDLKKIDSMTSEEMKKTVINTAVVIVERMACEVAVGKFLDEVIYDDVEEYKNLDLANCNDEQLKALCRKSFTMLNTLYSNAYRILRTFIHNYPDIAEEAYKAEKLLKEKNV